MRKHVTHESLNISLISHIFKTYILESFFNFRKNKLSSHHAVMLCMCIYSNSQSDEENETEIDESDSFDKRNGSEIYNLNEILSGSSSHNHHHPIHVNVEAVKEDKQQQKAKRYYIYSHTTLNDTNIDDDDDELMNRNNDKSRKIRSSLLQPNRKQISRNISLVLENLLKSYENSQLPTHGQGLISH